jgi:hypothetical protein
LQLFATRGFEADINEGRYHIGRIHERCVPCHDPITSLGRLVGLPVVPVHHASERKKKVLPVRLVFRKETSLGY